MRDKNRIFPFCTTFATFWQTYVPNLRFEQVLFLLKSFFKNPSFRNDPFYAEDEDWLEAIEEAEKYIKKNQKTS